MLYVESLDTASGDSAEASSLRLAHGIVCGLLNNMVVSQTGRILSPARGRDVALSTIERGKALVVPRIIIGEPDAAHATETWYYDFSAATWMPPTRLGHRMAAVVNRERKANVVSDPVAAIGEAAERCMEALHDAEGGLGAVTPDRIANHTVAIGNAMLDLAEWALDLPRVPLTLAHTRLVGTSVGAAARAMPLEAVR